MHRDGTMGINDRSLLASYKLMNEAERAEADPAFLRRAREAACQQAFENNAATPEDVASAVAAVAAVEEILRRTKKARRKRR
jgi:hypothetical protein